MNSGKKLVSRMSGCEVHQRWKLPPRGDLQFKHKLLFLWFLLQPKALGQGLRARQRESPAQASGLAFSWRPGLASRHRAFLDACLGLRFVPIVPVPPSQKARADQSKRGQQTWTANVGRPALWAWAGPPRAHRQWKALPGHLCGKSCLPPWH